MIKSETTPTSDQRILLNVNNLLSQLLTYSSSKLPQVELNDGLNQLFDYFIWAEKHAPSLLLQLFDMDILSQIQETIGKNNPLTFLKNHILLMMNSCEKGILAENLLHHNMPRKVLLSCLQNITSEQREEMVEYLGSFLKAYHRVFSVDWLSKFVVNGHFELLELCCKFYNCPEELTKTTVLNILLSLLSHPKVRSFIGQSKEKKKFYTEFAKQMCRQFKNELAEYNLRLQHVSKEDNVNLVLTEFEDKVSLWEDISNSAPELFKASFLQQILYPLLIGSIKNDKMPLFTLKFSFFALNKLVFAIHGFGLLQKLFHLLFFDQNVIYYSSSLFKSGLPPFSFHNLATLLERESYLKENNETNKIKEMEKEQMREDKNYPQENEERDKNEEEQESDDDDKEEFGGGIKNFFQTMLKTKDNHFMMMVAAFLSTLMKALTKNLDLKEKVGFNIKGNGKVLTMIIEVLIGQLREMHRINTVLSVVNTILILSEFQTLQADCQNVYIFTFSKVVEQTKEALKSKQQCWDSLVQILQYDLLFVDNYKFENSNNQKKYEDLYRVVFSWQPEEQESGDFYSIIPDTHNQHLRYLFLKFVILLKGRVVLLEGEQKNNIFMEYIEKTNFYKCPFRPGEVKNLVDIEEHYECELVEKENKIPAIFIPDAHYLIIGFHEKKQTLKIMIKAKLKHVNVKMITRKNKMLLQVETRKFNQEKGRVEERNNHIIRGKPIEHMYSFIMAKQSKVRENEVAFMGSLLKEAQQKLPFISLI